MAERHPREAALRRVHGTGALFAAAYGNVGSSIYYALGLVALYALGLTPVTFMIAGPDLRLHRGHLRRGDRALPGGRRLVELRPPRLQRARLLPRRLGADAHLHRHGRDLGLLRPALPGGLLGAARARARRTSSSGSGWSRCSRLLNVKGTEESARLNLVLAIADLLTQVVLVGDRAGARLRPRPARLPGRPRHRAELGRLRARDRGRDGRLHRDRDDLEHGRGGARLGADDPARDRR